MVSFALSTPGVNICHGEVSTDIVTIASPADASRVG